MARFCGNCGTMVSEDARVCGNCGKHLTIPAVENPGMEGYRNPAQNGYEAPAPGGFGAPKPPMDLKKMLIPVIGAVVALIVIVTGISIANKYTGTNAIIRQFEKCVETGENGEKLLKYYPDYIIEDEYFDEAEEKEDLKEHFERVKDNNEGYFGDHKVSYKIIRSKKMSEEELIEYQDDAEYENENYDIRRIKKGKIVKVRFTIKGEYDTENEIVEMKFIKDGFQWKLDPDSVGL